LAGNYIIVHINDLYVHVSLIIVTYYVYILYNITDHRAIYPPQVVPVQWW